MGLIISRLFKESFEEYSKTFNIHFNFADIVLTINETSTVIEFIHLLFYKTNKFDLDVYYDLNTNNGCTYSSNNSNEFKYFVVCKECKTDPVCIYCWSNCRHSIYCEQNLELKELSLQRCSCGVKQDHTCFHHTAFTRQDPAVKEKFLKDPNFYNIDYDTGLFIRLLFLYIGTCVRASATMEQLKETKAMDILNYLATLATKSKTLTKIITHEFFGYKKNKEEDTTFDYTVGGVTAIDRYGAVLYKETRPEFYGANINFLIQMFRQSFFFKRLFFSYCLTPVLPGYDEIPESMCRLRPILLFELFADYNIAKEYVFKRRLMGLAIDKIGYNLKKMLDGEEPDILRNETCLHYLIHVVRNNREMREHVFPNESARLLCLLDYMDLLSVKTSSAFSISLCKAQVVWYNDEVISELIHLLQYMEPLTLFLSRAQQKDNSRDIKSKYLYSKQILIAGLQVKTDFKYFKEIESTVDMCSTFPIACRALDYLHPQDKKLENEDKYRGKAETYPVQDISVFAMVSLLQMLAFTDFKHFCSHFFGEYKPLHCTYKLLIVILECRYSSKTQREDILYHFVNLIHRGIHIQPELGLSNSIFKFMTPQQVLSAIDLVSNPVDNTNTNNNNNNNNNNNDNYKIGEPNNYYSQDVPKNEDFVVKRSLPAIKDIITPPPALTNTRVLKDEYKNLIDPYYAWICKDYYVRHPITNATDKKKLFGEVVTQDPPKKKPLCQFVEKDPFKMFSMLRSRFLYQRIFAELKRGISSEEVSFGESADTNYIIQDIKTEQKLSVCQDLLYILAWCIQQYYDNPIFERPSSDSALNTTVKTAKKDDARLLDSFFAGRPDFDDEVDEYSPLIFIVTRFSHFEGSNYAEESLFDLLISNQFKNALGSNQKIRLFILDELKKIDPRFNTMMNNLLGSNNNNHKKTTTTSNRKKGNRK